MTAATRARPAPHADSLYVHIFIHGSVDDVWRLTQTPELHERWDLRFTGIEYLPRPDPSRPQRFRYTTRIGFGLKIEGEGETMGSQAGHDGPRTSALKFWSHDPKSLIREGSGYWKYTPAGGGVMFETGYDYDVRYGAAGRLLDRFVFRPLLGWATAWSFDRLRLWIEKQIPPEATLRSALVHAIARLGVGFVWLYQGLVPKLIFRHPDEAAMIANAGLPAEAVVVVGLLEVGLGVWTLAAWWQRWPFLVTLALMAVASAGAAATSPEYLAAAFNPVSLNLLMAALSLAGYLAGREAPSAGRCQRKRGATQ